MSTHPHLKEMKCDTCATLLTVERSSIGCQCYSCVMSRPRRPRVEEHELVVQLELGEVAS